MHMKLEYRITSLQKIHLVKNSMHVNWDFVSTVGINTLPAWQPEKLGSDLTCHRI